MRDVSFTLDAEAADSARPPYRYRFVNVPWPLPTWRIFDERGRRIAQANTRVGARAAVRAMYATLEG